MGSELQTMNGQNKLAALGRACIGLPEQRPECKRLVQGKRHL